MRYTSPKQMSPATRFFFKRIFPWPFILVGAVMLFFGTRGVYRAKVSLAWPTADGRIQNSSVEHRRGNKGRGTYHAEVLYTFVVNGCTHSSNQVAFGDYGSSSPSHAQNIVNRYPKGKVVAVRYLASNPDVCVLEPGLQLQAWFLPGFGVIFFLAGTLVAVFIPRWMKNQQEEPNSE